MEKLRNLTKNKNRKNFYLISLIIFAVSLAILFLVVFFSKTSILEKKEIPVTIRIGDKVGIIVTNKSLDFGIIPFGGGSSTKRITVQNNYDFNILIDFESIGETKDFLVFESPIYLKKGEIKEIGIFTVFFTDQPIGVYNGTLIVTYKRDFKHNNS